MSTIIICTMHTGTDYWMSILQNHSLMCTGSNSQPLMLPGWRRRSWTITRSSGRTSTSAMHQSTRVSKTQERNSSREGRSLPGRPGVSERTCVCACTHAPMCEITVTIYAVWLGSNNSQSELIINDFACVVVVSLPVLYTHRQSNYNYNSFIWSH